LLINLLINKGVENQMSETKNKSFNDKKKKKKLIIHFIGYIKKNQIKEIWL